MRKVAHNFWKSNKNWQSYKSWKTEIHSNLKPEDPFNFSHCIGLQEHALHVEDLIYVLVIKTELSHLLLINHEITEFFGLTESIKRWSIKVKVYMLMLLSEG